MRFLRYVSLVDAVVAIMVLFVVLLPPRTMRVVWAASAEPERLALALAEARVIDDQQNPTRDGTLVAELARRLGRSGFHDWAAETGARGALATDKAPTQWRALLAASIAYVDRLEPPPALAYAQRALAACEAARATDERVCPSWEEVRMDFYTRHLEAGVASGIDARKDPHGFRRAGEAALRSIRVKDLAPPAATPAPTAVPAPVPTPVPSAATPAVTPAATPAVPPAQAPAAPR